MIKVLSTQNRANGCGFYGAMKLYADAKIAKAA